MNKSALKAPKATLANKFLIYTYIYIYLYIFFNIKIAAI